MEVKLTSDDWELTIKELRSQIVQTKITLEMQFAMLGEAMDQKLRAPAPEKVLDDDS